jgi:hypothetical protein
LADLAVRVALVVLVVQADQQHLEAQVVVAAAVEAAAVIIPSVVKQTAPHLELVVEVVQVQLLVAAGLEVYGQVLLLDYLEVQVQQMLAVLAVVTAVVAYGLMPEMAVH